MTSQGAEQALYEEDEGVDVQPAVEPAGVLLAREDGVTGADVGEA